tara:strand:+ start:2235 stop:2714 length:480 start_codon:yes stop_codon:yes gene_type:complete
MLISGIALSQDCKYSINEVDKFTKKEIKETKRALLHGGLTNSLIFTLGNVDNDIRFIRFEIGIHDVWSVYKGDKAVILFENGETIEIESLDNVISEAYSDALSDSQTGSVSYFLTSEKMRKLEANKVEGVRIYMTSTTIDFEIKKKYSGNISERIKCIK